MKNRVLITGATSGIGREFTYIYAQRDCDLVLVSRDMEKLENLKSELTKNYNISVDTFSVDLSEHNSAERLMDYTKEIEIDILINNAGVGVYGELIKSDTHQVDAMLTLNISSLVGLTYFFAKKMTTNRKGKILNIASTAAFQPVPNFAAYAASKAFVLNFTEAINLELKPSGVTASVLCPGATATNFDKESNSTDTKLFKSGVMNAKNVAMIGVKQLDNNVMTKVPGCKNRIMAFASSANPFRGLAVKIANFMVNG